MYLFRSDVSLDEVQTTLRQQTDVFQFDTVAEHLRSILVRV